MLYKDWFLRGQPRSAEHSFLHLGHVTAVKVQSRHFATHFQQIRVQYVSRHEGKASYSRRTLRHGEHYRVQDELGIKDLTQHIIMLRQ